jgi:hypothetical protein
MDLISFAQALNEQVTQIPAKRPPIGKHKFEIRAKPEFLKAGAFWGCARGPLNHNRDKTSPSVTNGFGPPGFRIFSKTPNKHD